MDTYFVDLATCMPESIEQGIGRLTILFGRLEHMTLLAIKRKSGITMSEAQDRYGERTLGGKVTVLEDLSDDELQLLQICRAIRKINHSRNRLLHGLITTVAESSVVFAKRQGHLISDDFLYDLDGQVIELIERLNAAIPVPGVEAHFASGPDLDLRYSEAAFAGEDRLVSLLSDEAGETDGS